MQQCGRTSRVVRSANKTFRRPSPRKRRPSNRCLSSKPCDPTGFSLPWLALRHVLLVNSVKALFGIYERIPGSFKICSFAVVCRHEGTVVGKHQLETFVRRGNVEHGANPHHHLTRNRPFARTRRPREEHHRNRPLPPGLHPSQLCHLRCHCLHTVSVVRLPWVKVKRRSRCSC